MKWELEQQLRHAARWKRERGILGWDADLRAAGLDPERWSGGVPAFGEVAPAVYVAEASRLAPPTKPLLRSGALASKSYDAASRTIDVIWTTGAAVLRYDLVGLYTEVLDITPAAVRLGRLNAGAPFCNSHQSGLLEFVLGAVVPGSARIAGGKGTCQVQLSDAPDKVNIVGDIISGIIRNVSVGYLIHNMTWSEDASGAMTCRVTDWEPFEVSAVAVPADPAAQVRRLSAAPPPGPSVPVAPRPSASELRRSMEKLRAKYGLQVHEPDDPEARRQLRLDLMEVMGIPLPVEVEE